MDFAGRDIGKLRYSLGRPLTSGERALRYDQKTTSNAPSRDFLSTIKLNSTYIELVDRWYPLTGFSTWFGTMVAAVSGGILVAIFHALFFSGRTAPLQIADWIALAAFTPIFLLIGWVGVFILRTECWRWTHYPMRLNRKTRLVHVFRQNGTILTVPWDDLYIVRGEANSPLAGTTYDLRAHVLDADGRTVRESFSLGYTFPGTEDSMDKFWAFLQPYMEAPDGVERTYRHLKGGLLMPLDGRKEGWRWSIVRTFAPGWPYPWTMLLLCIPLGLNALGRMFAMATSKQPRWPDDIEATNVVEPGDTYQLTWRDNGPLGWWELYWPLICTILGAGAFFGVIGSILSTFWE